MRVLLPVPLVAAAAVSALPPSPAAADAYAAPADHGGVLEVRDGSTGRIVRDGAPEVCTFSLRARDLDRSQRVSWHIAQRPADGVGDGTGDDGTIAETGTLSVDGHGNGRSEPLSLADGTYTLGWRLDGSRQSHGTTDLTISCGSTKPSDRTSAPARSRNASEATRGGAPGTSPSEASTARPGGGADADTPGPTHRRSTPPDTPSPGSTAADGGAAPSSPSPAARRDDLAQSGTDVSAGTLATGAALLLGAGTYLLLRRRKPHG